MSAHATANQVLASSHNHNFNGTVAYAVSPVSQLNAKSGKQAPLVATNNNESFDDEDQRDDDDEDDDEEDGCYESPTAALRNKIENYHSHQLSQTTVHQKSEQLGDSSVNTNHIGFVYTSQTIGGSDVANNNNNTNNIGNSASSGSSGGEQYDHVDHSAYEQSNGGVYIDESEPIIGTALVMYSFAGRTTFCRFNYFLAFLDEIICI